MYRLHAVNHEDPENVRKWDIDRETEEEAYEAAKTFALDLAQKYASYKKYDWYLVKDGTYVKTVHEPFRANEPV